MTVTPAPIVYHYTGPNGVKGIVDTQCLCPTNYRYLNDVSEMKMFPHVFWKWWFQEDSGVDRSLKPCIESLFDALLSNPREPPLTEHFVVSFCGVDNHRDGHDDGDRLSQWRAYGPRGGLFHRV